MVNAAKDVGIPLLGENALEGGIYNPEVRDGWGNMQAEKLTVACEDGARTTSHLADRLATPVRTRVQTSSCCGILARH